MRYWLIIFAGLAAAFAAQAREVLTLGLEEVSQAVRKEFVEQGINSDVELEFFGGQTAFVLENVEEAKILVSGLDVSEGQNKFTAEAEIFADGKPAGKTKLFGRYFVLTEAYVPARDIAKDAIIQEDDLAMVKMRANRLREDMVFAKDDLTGKQATRLIKADKPVTSRDIRDEIIIKKNQIVTAVYRNKGLQITSKTEALENGAKGQRIKLLNTKSQKEIIGKVIDKNTVEIAAE